MQEGLIAAISEERHILKHFIYHKTKFTQVTERDKEEKKEAMFIIIKRVEMNLYGSFITIQEHTAAMFRTNLTF